MNSSSSIPPPFKAKLSPTEEKAMQQLDGQMVALLRRIDKMRRETEEQQQQQPMRRGSQLEPPKSPRTTTVQLKKDDSSLESEGEGTKFPWTKLEDKSSPPPLNEAESLRWINFVGLDLPNLMEIYF